MKNLFNFSPSPEAWRGAGIGVLIAVALLIALSTIDLLQHHVSLGDASIYFFAAILVTATLGVILVCLCAFFTRASFLTWAIACFGLCSYYFFSSKQTNLGILLVGMWTTISFSLAYGSLWSLLANRNENQKRSLLRIGFLFLGSFGIVFLIFWLTTNQSYSLPSTMVGKKQVQQITLPNPSISGSYVVKTLSYGHGKDLNRHEYGTDAAILTETVNGDLFIDNWEGLSGKLRSRYWGFDDKHIPLNGKVWYPEGKGPFPLVMIVHGNHEMSVPSENGYAYLAKLWASRGFIAVSIDQNFLNGAWFNITDELNEVAARGWLILEHLNLWREWNDAVDSPFSNRVDMQKIALVGHSRGGEAIATAAAFNDLDFYPDNGNITFDYHFNIRALAAIAPVDAQYLPGGKKTDLKNIDYFVIHGAHDSDIRSFQGTGQYNRVHFNDSQYHFKAALYVFGANHTQFNSEWGKNDVESPANLFFYSNHFLKEEEQRQIAKVYLTAFLEISLNHENGYLPLFHSWRTAKAWLPKTIYLNEFSDSNESFIINNQKKLDQGKATLSGRTIKGENLKIWQQKKITLRENQSYQTGTYLGWDTSALSQIPSYTITLTHPEKGLEIDAKSTLVLSLADSSNNEEEKEEKSKNEKSIDFTIELTDSFGEMASLPLSNDAFLQLALAIQVMKSPFLDPLNSSESIFQTFEFPLEDFIAVNPRFTPTSLQTIRLLFNKTTSGLIIVKSISIRN